MGNQEDLVVVPGTRAEMMARLKKVEHGRGPPRQAARLQAAAREGAREGEHHHPGARPRVQARGAHGDRDLAQSQNGGIVAARNAAGVLLERDLAMTDLLANGTDGVHGIYRVHRRQSCKILASWTS